MLKKLIIILIIITATIVGVFVFRAQNNKEISAAATRTGLISYWTMDSGDINGTTFYDKSGSGRHAASVATTPGTGIIKQSRVFNGSTSFIMPGTYDIAKNDNFTLSAWVKVNGMTSTLGQSYVIAKGSDSATPFYGLLIGTSDTSSNISKALVCFVVGDAFPLKTACSSEGLFSDKKWHHIIGTDENKTMKIYVDGVYHNTNSYAGSIADSANLILIGRQNRGAPYEYYFNGSIDDVRFYDRGLSAQEVADLYNSAKVNFVNTATRASSTPTVSGQLVGHWTMDSGDRTGNKILDKSGFNNNGTLSGVMVTSTGKIGQSITFNGAGNYIAANTINPADPHHITMSAWIKKTAFTAENGIYADIIMAKGNDFLANSYLIAANAAGGLFSNSSVCVEIYTTEPLQFACSSTGALIYGKWHHIIGVINGQNIYIYLDGVLRGQNTITGTISPSANTFWIGRQNRAVYSYDFAGQIDDARIYNYAFSAQDVSNLYNSAKTNYASTPARNGLVGWWTMDAGDVNAFTIYDKSGQDNHGTRTGSTTSTGIIKQSRRLNGSTDYIQMTDDASLKPSAVTVSAWVKLNSMSTGASCGGAGNSMYVVFKKNSRTTGWFEGYTLQKVDTVGWQFAVSTAGATLDGALSAVPPVVGQWTHLVGTFNQPDLRIYVNGVLSGTDTHNFPLDYGTWPIFIGRSGECGGGGHDTWDSFFNGDIDDVRIYERAFSAQEVANLYNSARGNYK